MASCAWDKTAVIWKFDSSKFTAHQKLVYPGESPGQVRWSPNGKHLLVKSAHGIKLWESEVCKPISYQERGRSIIYVDWELATNDSLASVHSLNNLDAKFQSAHNYRRAEVFHTGKGSSWLYPSSSSVCHSSLPMVGHCASICVTRLFTT